MEKEIMRNKRIGIIFGGLCGLLFFILLFMKDSIQGNWLILFPVTLVIGLFFATLSASGNIKNALKNTFFMFGFGAVLILIAFLLRK